MRKIVIPLIIIAVILLQALPALADSNTIRFYLHNSSEKTKLTWEVKGIENIDFYFTGTTRSGSTEETRAEATAWFISPTTYRWKITAYRSSSTDKDKLAEFTLKCVNYFLLYPAISEFGVEEKTIYQGDFTVKTDTFSDGSADITIRGNVDES